MDILLTFHHVHARHAYMQFYHTQLSACTSDNHSLNGVAIYRHFSAQVNVHTSHFRPIYCILVSHPPPACFFGTRFAGIIVRSRALYASMLLISFVTRELHKCLTH